MKVRFLFSMAVALNAAAAEPQIKDVEGQNEYVIEYTGATDFSGVTWIGGDSYYAVANKSSALFPLRMEVNEESGRIDSAKFGKKIPVKPKGEDFEGIAFLPSRDRFYVSTERPPGIVGFDREGDATFRVEVPKIFAEARSNKGLESLAYGAGHFWTANEDTLRPDGELSSGGRGGLVRLQKFNERFQPVAQYAYRTDSSLLRVSNSGTGVTDLVVLPDGGLLVLERVVAVGLWAKIYRVDLEDATDTSEMDELNGTEVQPVKKTLLYERPTGRNNFEGIALGKELAGGWRSLILIADSAGEHRHVMIPLRLRIVAED